MPKQIHPEQLARAARMYKTNQAAARALGIGEKRFARLCQAYRVEVPYSRQQLRAERGPGCSEG
jgi:hypothetical protein